MTIGSFPSLHFAIGLAEILADPQRFREEWLNPFFADCPELLPDFAKGYEMNGRCHSKRLGLDIRRIALRSGEQYRSLGNVVRKYRTDSLFSSCLASDS